MHEPTPPLAVRRRVQAGLGMFFAGAAGLLLAAIAQLGTFTEALPGPALWLVPHGPAGYTAATLLVVWGVWTMGSGVRLARER